MSRDLELPDELDEALKRMQKAIRAGKEPSGRDIDMFRKNSHLILPQMEKQTKLARNLAEMLNSMQNSHGRNMTFGAFTMVLTSALVSLAEHGELGMINQMMDAVKEHLEAEGVQLIFYVSQGPVELVPHEEEKFDTGVEDTECSFCGTPHDDGDEDDAPNISKED